VGAHGRRIGWSWDVEQRAALVEHEQAAIQALSELAGGTPKRTR
jgi:hypothetical protein